jgi:hypothetical protein
MQSIAVIARLPWSIARARRTGGGERCVFECFLVGRAALTTATPFAWF